MAADRAIDAKDPRDDAVRRVEEALVRAQELVDRKPPGPGNLAWYIEAAQMGELSVLARLLALEAERDRARRSRGGVPGAAPGGGVAPPKA